MLLLILVMQFSLVKLSLPPPYNDHTTAYQHQRINRNTYRTPCSNRIGSVTNCFGEPNLTYIGTVNNNSSKEIEFFIDSSQLNGTRAIRVHTSSKDSTVNHPLIVVIRRQNDVISWKIPVKVKTNVNYMLIDKEYNEISRTLCPISDMPTYQAKNGMVDYSENLAISLTTSSEKDVSFSLEIDIEDFVLVMDDGTKVNLKQTSVAPAKPTFYKFNFDDNVSQVLLLSLIHISEPTRRNAIT